jgi:hypothetical protein
VGELDTHLLVLRVRELDNLGRVLNLGVIPQANILGGDASLFHHWLAFCEDSENSMAYLRKNGGSLLNGQSRATGENSTKVGHVPGGHLSIVGRVLAERRKHDAVVELGAADLERLEQRRGVAAIGLRVVGSSCRRVLGRSEVGNLEMTMATLIDVRMEVLSPLRTDQ